MVRPEQCPLMVQYVKAYCHCRPKGSGVLWNIASNAALSRPRSNQVYKIGGNETDPKTIPVATSGLHVPIWQVYPPNNQNAFVMYDLFSDSIGRRTLKTMMETKGTVISKTYGQQTPNLWNFLLGVQLPTFGDLMFSPVFGKDGNDIIGSIVIDFDFRFLVGSLVPVESKGIDIVLENSCGQKRTFSSDGTSIDLIGDGDLHDPKYASMMMSSTYEDFLEIQRTTSPENPGGDNPMNCAYRIVVCSSKEFRSTYISNKPRLYAMSVILIFVFTSLVFITYDCYVTRRQKNLMEAALQRDEIVSSLFPAVVRARLFGADQRADRSTRMSQRSLRHTIAQFITQLQGLSTPQLHVGGASIRRAVPRSEPIADFLPMVSVIFADISGFTAWSSEREPSQVFQLLETVYQEFDKIALKCGIFKVETIGDCFVAATCIPVYQPDHSVRIVKFAQSCLLHMHELTRELEATLGPSTSSLSIRIGIHSGPVIAGVLRGAKSRFQLFGDTMNTAAQMQASCKINMIQISNATATVLSEAGMSHWIKPRDKPISLKGKGVVQTFWVDPVLSVGNVDDVVIHQSQSHDAVIGETARPWGDTTVSDRLSSKISLEEKVRRMVEWNTDLMMRFLKKVAANTKIASRNRLNIQGRRNSGKRSQSQVPPLAEATDILTLPGFLEKAANKRDLELLDLGEAVQSQLQDYIANIASMYKDIPFHNFEHACHVTMSAAKIVMRIIRPNVQIPHETLARGRVELKRKIHHSTFGISSDALLQFAVVFSALIHDVDHTGVSNSQLIKEGHDAALKYGNMCVAEQNSVDIAWDLLMKEKYLDLRKCLCRTEVDLKRFRQLLVNAVIATDIADKQLQARRKNRWDRAFHSPESDRHGDQNDINLKATIVFEYIIQASDVSHTMQHWKVYKQWNERLFEERLRAFQVGREERDPSVGWYQGELWFFDNYIIPLARKLETCGVFGVSSDEYLSYALENRREWELKGEEIVRSMVNKYRPSMGTFLHQEIDS